MGNGHSVRSPFTSKKIVVHARLPDSHKIGEKAIIEEETLSFTGQSDAKHVLLFEIFQTFFKMNVDR